MAQGLWQPLPRGTKFTVTVEYVGKLYHLPNCALGTTIGRIKQLFVCESGVSFSCRVNLIFRHEVLMDHQTLREIGNGTWNHKMTLMALIRTVGGGMAYVRYEERRKCIVFTNRNQKEILMPIVHVACRSSKLPPLTKTLKGVNMLGMILYGYDGKTDWYLNGIHCRTGYLYIRHAKEIKKIKTKRDTMHAKLYKSLFKVDIDYSKNIIGAGFAIEDGVIQYKSSTFNVKSVTRDDGWHDNNRLTDKIEKKCIYHALGIWRHSRGRTQNTRVSDWWANRDKKPDYL